MTDAPLVVAGAGAGGLAAALSAADFGREVVLVERSQSYRRGCNTAMSTSMIPAPGSRWQRALGIEDSPAQFAEDIRRKTKGTADPVLTEALTEVGAPLVEWLADRCGVPLDLVTDFTYPGHSAPRCHSVPDRSGQSLHGHLIAAAQADPRITLVVGMELADVITEGDAVTGAILRTPDGAVEEVPAGAVVLAVNGFGANAELVRRYLPEIADGTYHGGEGSRGDALRIGERLGADVSYLDAYQGHGSLATPHAILLTWAAMVHGGVLINTDGQRFGDETMGYSEFGPIVVRQPGSVAWAVFDERIDQLCRPFADYQDLLRAGAVRSAADLDELAAIIGCPLSALTETLQACAAVAAGQGTDAWGRTDFSEGLKPPYRTVKVTGALFHTQGGLTVDRHARVLRGGQPIPGLYAVGGSAAGISGHGCGGYLAGNGLLAALGLGYLAGRHYGG